MKNHFLALAVLMLCLAAVSAPAQDSTPPATPEDMEAAYATAIEKRTADILQQLGLEDEAKASRVHDAIIAQYRALRSRDEVIDGLLSAHGIKGSGNEAERASLLACMSQPLHQRFLAKLSADLSPAQIEQVKDKMTYNKVKVTYDAYCSIVPGLSEADKAKILEVLKGAREEAMDGGSAKEKSDIFQKYKDKINAHLTAQGHDLEKAFKEWAAKEEAARKAQSASEAQSPQAQ